MILPWLLFALRLVSATEANVAMTWDFPAERFPQAYYRISKSPDCGPQYTVVATQGAAQQTWQDTQVQTGGRYCYYVTACCNSDGTASGPSNILDVTLEEALPSPSNLREQ